MKFRQKFDTVVKKNNSLLCIGLDPEIDKLPQHIKISRHPFFNFNKAIIDATHDYVCAYKPNIAFYEARGLGGLEGLKMTMEYLQKNYPTIPVILDAKRADIGNTARMYAKSVFEYWDADAVTVYPHLGRDSLEPFFQYKDKLVILLIHTSNPDAKMFQELLVGKYPYYLALAKEIATWKDENLGIFMGATYPEELKKVRSLFPDRILLSAGMGAQKGNTQRAVLAGVDKNNAGIMFNASRSILYASQDKDFAVAARKEAERLQKEINSYRFTA